MQIDVYMCIVDYAKAFDKVQHITLFEIFQELDVNGKAVELIKNLHSQQQAAVRIGQDMSDCVNIRRGVRQGCVYHQKFSHYTHRYNEENQPHGRSKNRRDQCK